MGAEQTMAEIEWVERIFAAPDNRPLSPSDLAAATRRHDEILAQSSWFRLGNGLASAEEVKPKAGFGFRVSAAWPSSASISKSLRVPIRVCRPLLTGDALRRSPLMEAGGAYPASVEGVPLIAAATRPAVIHAG